MESKIQLLEDVIGAYDVVYKKGEILDIDEPYQGINEDGLFTICGGMGIYTEISKDKYKLIEVEIKNTVIKTPFYNPIKI
jgi:hypothetical protein